MKEAILIYPQQLFKENKLLHKKATVFLVEEPLLFTQFRFHKQKLILHRASMKAYADQLVAQGYSVIYIESTDIHKTEDIATILKKHSITSIEYYDPVDTWLDQRLAKSLTHSNIACTVHESPQFLTTTREFSAYFDSQKGSRKYFMKNFYEWQRKRLDILIKGGKPVGGSWSYDTENRKKLPKGVALPDLPHPSQNSYVIEAKKYIAKHFETNYGDDYGFFYPVTHTEAEGWLVEFLHYKLELFGPYEDALTTRQNILFHSVLSPLLNCGLLTPDYVVAETLHYAKNNTVSIASLEGFLRQIIGWREYMRAIYVLEGSRIRTSNYFNAKRDIPESFWTASTGIDPIDLTIQGTLTTSYSHHIERLMVMGNFMNLCGFKPNQVHKWFMELYIDAYDWVMVPNVYSMALYADGGIITTKPYISGSNYILKMSDYKKGAWSDTWDALFWNFVGTYYEVLQKEGRLGFVGVLYGKMSAEKRAQHKELAEQFLGNL
jgi:deoxyribodipyrimidine photolyase-related protein